MHQSSTDPETLTDLFVAYTAWSRWIYINLFLDPSWSQLYNHTNPSIPCV